MDGVVRPIRRRPSALVVVATTLLIAVTAVGVSFSAPAAVDAASVAKLAACRVNLRTRPTTTAHIRRTVATRTRVTVVATVSGGRWHARCGGRVVKGYRWYRISAINGRSVRSLYGITYLYAASGLFKAAPAPTTAAPAPTTTPPTPAPVAGAANLADYGGDWSAAMTAAKTHGNVLYVPAGTWRAPRIFPYAGLTIRGAGAGLTIIDRNAPGALAAGGFFHVTTNDVTISDLTLRGWPTSSGPSDDILIYGLNAQRLTVQRVNLLNPQGVGLFTEGSTTGGLFEDITIQNVLYRSNGYHGVGLWAYKGSSGNTYRRITIDGTNYNGIMIDAGTTGSTDAASVNDNLFEDIVIRHAARQALPNGGGMGAGWMFTGGARNIVRGYEITDQSMGAALAFGADQSGIGSTQNNLSNGTVLRINSTDVISLGGGATSNTFNGGSGGGHVVGQWSGNTITNWPGLIY
jgi:hypothetical protein